jgi:uncharacterized protein YecT (DUF1311 family)
MEILMKGMWRLARLAVVVYLFSASLTAQTPSTGGDTCSQSADATQMDLNRCAAKELQKAESRLAALLKELGIDRNSPEQKAWEAYRDAQLQAIYPAIDSEIAEYGSVYAMLGNSEEAFDRRPHSGFERAHDLRRGCVPRLSRTRRQKSTLWTQRNSPQL